MRRQFYSGFLFLFLLITSASAQTVQKPVDKTIDASTRQAALQEAVKQIRENYVFADVGEKVAADIERRMQNKEYDNITSAFEFAETLTRHLQAISSDKHMYVRVMSGTNPNPFTPEKARAGNYGITKAEILPNNIGYLKINEFPPPDMVKETLAASMKFVANTDALIIDLREHRGGAVQTVAMTVSYFVPEKRIQLLTVSSPRTNTGNESWTLEKVEGPRYLDKPVYLLTSAKTFSGGEEFAYDMQALKRATLIGQTTGGGANPVRLFPLQNTFLLGVSIAQVKNTITGTNWEGKGVKPEIEVPVEQALQKAQETALQKLQEKNKDNQQVAQTSQPKAETEIKLPETRAGKTFASFLKALNSGDLVTMKNFHKELGSDENNAQQDFNFYQQSGGLSPHSVVESSEYSITVLVQTKKNGDWLRFEISLEQNPPYSIADVRVRPTTKPESMK